MPRYLALLHGDPTSEAGIPPSRSTLSEMHAYNADLLSAGALLSGEGLHPTSKGARVHFPPPPSSAIDPAPTAPVPVSETAVTFGPFEYTMSDPGSNLKVETADLKQVGEGNRPVCGFWLVKAKDLGEAVGLVRKAPLAGTYIEVREVFESCDVVAMSEEMEAKEDKETDGEGKGK